MTFAMMWHDTKKWFRARRSKVKRKLNDRLAGNGAVAILAPRDNKVNDVEFFIYLMGPIELSYPYSLLAYIEHHLGYGKKYVAAAVEQASSVVRK